MLLNVFSSAASADPPGLHPKPSAGACPGDVCCAFHSQCKWCLCKCWVGWFGNHSTPSWECAQGLAGGSLEVAGEGWRRVWGNLSQICHYHSPCSQFLSLSQSCCGADSSPLGIKLGLVRWELISAASYGHGDAQNPLMSSRMACDLASPVIQLDVRLCYSKTRWSRLHRTVVLLLKTSWKLSSFLVPLILGNPWAAAPWIPAKVGCENKVLPLRCSLDKQGVEFSSSHAHVSECNSGKVGLICLSPPSQAAFPH